MSKQDDWKLFFGDGRNNPAVDLPPPPPWRDFQRSGDHRAITYKPGDFEIKMVNTAIYLRRPLLVTGPPGSGKSSLIDAVAKELGLGTVLRWPINSRSTLTEGLYRYDAVARLRDVGLARAPGVSMEDDTGDARIGRYLTLGPLGTALYPATRPRALLIDEIDKSDIDLPNDLLHVFEEGWYEIPELVRISSRFPQVQVSAWQLIGQDGLLSIERGQVRVTEFPFVVITSNGERDLPPAFLRRCLRLDMTRPDVARLSEIVRAHLASAEGTDVESLIHEFLKAHDDGRLIAIDQLLNAVYMTLDERVRFDVEWARIRESLLRDLNRT